MNAGTRRLSWAGPAGPLEVAIDEPAGPALGIALVLHPLPTHGGTMDNKVVQTLARGAVALGLRAVRFNFRGVGASAGAFDGGAGETDDAAFVAEQVRDAHLPFALAGFSFGAFVATKLAERCAQRGSPVDHMALIGLAASRFPATQVPADTLVVHGEADDVVPLSAVLDWARPQALPVTVVPGAGHYFHGQLPLLKSLLTRAWAPAFVLPSS
ncbi:alpha/beta hydrolase [Inhella crocodyli]|uniref:Alpha/beta hydrolase n=1 Tax=Inhella crocodyli TaxID=2499851 RepID=A0A437LGW6_9BURK|nr:thioesterase domain-containing protein [Inhella crocodyli]RVT84623.1 alpha/beta hydrolase [Inhella crocodyli]